MTGGIEQALDPRMRRGTLAFLAAMVALKCLYVLTELYYNRTVLEFVATPSFSESHVRALESLGHWLAAAGATLLTLALVRRPLSAGIDAAERFCTGGNRRSTPCRRHPQYRFAGKAAAGLRLAVLSALTGLCHVALGRFQMMLPEAWAESSPVVPALELSGPGQAIVALLLAGVAMRCLRLILRLTSPVMSLAGRSVKAAARVMFRPLAWITVLAAIGAGWHHTQVVVMDTLVAKSSPELRYDAYYLNLLRTLLARGAADYPGFYDPGEELSYNGKITLASMPLVLLDEGSSVEQLRRSGEPVLKYTVRLHAMETRFEDDWRLYRTANARILELWGAYREIMSRVEARALQALSEGAAAYDRVLRDADRRYQEYLSATKELAAKADELQRSPRTLQTLYNFFRYARDEGEEARQTGGRATVKERRAFIAVMRRATGHAVGYEVFCTAGAGDRLVCPRSVGELRVRVPHALRRVFSDQTGVPVGLSQEEFLEHPLVQATAVEAAAEHGLQLPGDHGFRAAPVFEAILGAASAEAQATLDAHLNNPHGLDLQPGLSFEEFAEHPSIQSALEDVSPAVAGPIPLLLDKRGFFQQVWAPAVDRSIERGLSDLLPKERSAFADDARGQLGKDAVKMLFVIPAALTISGFVGVMNAALLVTSAFALGAGTLARHLDRLRGPKPSGAALRLAVRVRRLVIALVALTLLLPFALEPPLLTEQPELAALAQAAHEEHPVLATLWRWLVIVEAWAAAAGECIHALFPDALTAQIDARLGLE